MKKIKLTQGKYAIVDDEDYEYINQWKWCYHDGYATRGQYSGIKNGKQLRETIRMHRLINNTPNGMETDHINRYKLDNRKYNLRSCTRTQNQINTGLRQDNKSGFKGVCWHKRDKKWRVQIRVDGKIKSLGYFTDIACAASAYKNAGGTT